MGFCNREISYKVCINLDTSNARLFPNMTGSILSEWRCDVKPFSCICMLGPVTPACSNSTEEALVKEMAFMMHACKHVGRLSVQQTLVFVTMMPVVQ